MYAAEVLLTDEDFLIKVERAVRQGAAAVAAESAVVPYHLERVKLATIIADDASAAREYAIRFSRLLIGNASIVAAAANGTAPSAISQGDIEFLVNQLWYLFAVHTDPVSFHHVRDGRGR